ncbi:MAG TPA: DUF177 domain-containing protein [Actinomycetota bacterium]|nr:DUF177 domain-containing protein [Actinomycetota bacterium]
MQTFTIPVTEVLGKPGASTEVEVAAPLEGAGTALACLDGTPVRVTGRLDGVVEGILVAGRAVGSMVARCARCLDELPSAVELELCELFVGAGQEADEDAYRVKGMEIDLEPMLRDAFVLALPLNPLCRKDCAGLCARCGANLNNTSCDCVEETGDPRWAALDEVRAQLEAADSPTQG